jgi:hypothetical protein
MRKIILTVIVLGALALGAHAGNGSRYNPYAGPFGGWDFDDGTSAHYSPYAGPYGGYNFSNGGSLHWNPYKGPFGGWDSW